MPLVPCVPDFFIVCLMNGELVSYGDKLVHDSRGIVTAVGTYTDSDGDTYITVEEGGNILANYSSEFYRFPTDQMSLWHKESADKLHLVKKSRFGHYPSNNAELHNCWLYWNRERSKYLKGHPHDAAGKLRFGQFLFNSYVHDDQPWPELFYRDWMDAYCLAAEHLNAKNSPVSA